MRSASIRVAKPVGSSFQVVIEADGAKLATLSVSVPEESGQQTVTATELSRPWPPAQARMLHELAAEAVAQYKLSLDIDIATPPTLARARPAPLGEAIVPGTVASAQLALLAAHRKRYGFARQFCAGKRVLDLACGAGYGARMLALAAAWVVAADFDEQAVSEATWRFARDNIVHVCADGTRVPLPNAAVDVVVTLETIEHLRPQQVPLFLGELHRVLASGGTLVMSTPRVEGPLDGQWGLVNLTGEHQRGHQVGFSTEALRAWLGRFFAHVAILYQGSQQPQEDPVPQLELWPTRPPHCETLVAVASDTPFDSARFQVQRLPLNLYDAGEVERFLAHPGVVVVHATIEKRGPAYYAAFALAHEGPGDRPPAYALLDYVRVSGLGAAQAHLLFPAEWAAAARWADRFAAILSEAVRGIAWPEQTFQATLPPSFDPLSSLP